MIIEVLVFGLGMIVVAVTVGYTLALGISPMPTSRAVRRAMLDMLPERLEGEVLELGSGWGGLAFALATKFPDNRVRAFELSPLPWLVSRLRLMVLPKPNLTICRRNFLAAPLGQAGLVTCYLFPGGMKALKPKMETELKPGTLVLSNTFHIPGWAAQREEAVADLHGTRVLLYQRPMQGQTE